MVEQTLSAVGLGPVACDSMSDELAEGQLQHAKLLSPTELRRIMMERLNNDLRICR
jgi:hypothetical protein